MSSLYNTAEMLLESAQKQLISPCLSGIVHCLSFRDSRHLVRSVLKNNRNKVNSHIVC